MRAVVLRTHGGPDCLTIENVDDPAVGADEVLIDIAASALNRADLLQVMGLYPANSIFVGDYLTTQGQTARDDLRMIEDAGFVLETPDGEPLVGDPFAGIPEVGVPESYPRAPLPLVEV